MSSKLIGKYSKHIQHKWLTLKQLPLYLSKQDIVIIYIWNTLIALHLLKWRKRKRGYYARRREKFKHYPLDMIQSIYLCERYNLIIHSNLHHLDELFYAFKLYVRCNTCYIKHFCITNQQKKTKRRWKVPCIYAMHVWIYADFSSVCQVIHHKWFIFAFHALCESIIFVAFVFQKGTN